ncbi:MAG TPA: response regulator [Bdellovibrionales bacterium]|nr:response regulator [Bdellovibrionales bacterium]
MQSSREPILIVEDDPSIRNGLKELLELEGHDVVTAENGLEGLKKLESITPCLVLLDLMMPVLDGYGFLRTLIKEKPEVKAETPVILLTAAGQREAASQLVDEVVTKPVDIDRLLDIVKKHCRD